MAVHVVQGKDPWWAPLAVNVLGGLYNDWQQRERNKKEAAFLGELARLGAGTQDNTAPAPAQDAGQGLLGMGATDNSDGWTNALHKTENPLLQFDIGTAGLAPKAPAVNTPAPTNAWANALGNAGSQLGQFDANTAGIVPATPAQSTTRAPMVTPMDWYNAAMQLAGTKRFRMISPDRVQALLTPYMKVNEEARKEQMRNELADEIAGAADSAERIRKATGGAVRGVIPESMLNTIFNQSKANPFTLNTGGQTLLGSTDSMSGKPTFFEAVNNTLTPAQALDDQFRRLQHEARVAQNQAQMAYNYAQLQQTGEIERQRLANADRQTYTIRAGGDGKLYWVDNRNQTISPVMNGDVHMDALPSEINGVNGYTFNDADKKYLELQYKKAENLRKDIQALETRRKNEVGDDLANTDREIATKRAEIDRLYAETENFINNRRSVPTNNSRSRQNTQEQTVPPVGQGNNNNPINTLPPAVSPLAQNTADAIRIMERNRAGFSAADNEAVFRRKSDGKIYTGKMVRDIMRRADNGELRKHGVNSGQEVLNWLVAEKGFEPITDIINKGIKKASQLVTGQPNQHTAYTTQGTQQGTLNSGATVNSSDRNTDMAMQRALDNLNVDFGEQRWADWANGLDVQGIGSMIRNLPAPLPSNGGIGNLPDITPNRPFNFDDIERLLGNPNVQPEYMLAGNRRARPQPVLSGRYVSDTRNGGQYSSIINRHAKKNNVDPDLIAAIIQQESGGNSRAVSSAGAQGLMQLMPKTAQGLGVANSFDPEQNISGGTRYIAQMLKRYKGNVEKALWAYNAGPGNADKGRLPDETRKYIPSVMARYRRLKGIATGTTQTPKRNTSKRRSESREDANRRKG